MVEGLIPCARRIGVWKDTGSGNYGVVHARRHRKLEVGSEVGESSSLGKGDGATGSEPYAVSYKFIYLLLVMTDPGDDDYATVYLLCGLRDFGYCY